MLGEKAHRQIYTVLLALLGITMVSSVFAANLVWVLLGVNWLAEGRWHDKWRRAKESRLLWAVGLFYGLLLVGMLWTSDTANGLRILEAKLPLLVLPLVILTTPPLAERPRRAVAAIYSVAVIVVSIIAIIRLNTIPDLPYRQAVPHLSHIRFSLNCCIVLYLLVGQIHRPTTPLAARLALLLSVGWLLAVLLSLHSLTALSILAIVSLAIPLYRRRWAFALVWLTTMTATATIVGIEVKRYYRPSPLAQQPLPTFTAAGHPYIHLQDGLIENGNYINNHLCPEELASEWNKRSVLPYDGTAQNGYTIAATLIRYLNASGLTKDSVGVANLTDAEIRAVEQGVANPVYRQPNPIRRIVYTTLFEREHYRHTHATAGFSNLQRLALWEATADIIAHHPLAGVGTGDVVQAIQEVLTLRGSDLAGTPMRSHNQYLGTAAAVGLPAALLVLLLVLWAAYRAWSRRHSATSRATAFALAYALTIAISMLTEDTLDTLMGILVSLFPLVLLPPRGKEEPTPAAAADGAKGSEAPCR
ncbi:MAG: O-antigen ligase family protein [Bacteroidales bacterium]|nr:O-antigen ligase family protein [Bacteroidales bacterium]